MKSVRDRGTGQVVQCPECVTGEWATPRKQFGWSAGYWEPGGYFYDVDGKWRASASYVIVFNIILAVGQLSFWWLALTIARASLETFIYQTIFFTFTTNLVTWFFALNTWKYARDSRDALVKYSDDTDKAMKEFGMTIADLNDIGRAIVENGITGENVREAIKEFRQMLTAWREVNVSPAEIKETVEALRKARTFQATEERLQAPKFESPFNSEVVANG